MDQLIASRLKKPQEQSRLDTLSPQKFGRSAYANLTYTPSKLATNVLFKEVSQMRRVEQNGSKARQFEALNAMLREKNRHLLSQKDGIEQTLSQQIIMYKKMIAQMQETQEQRIHQLQTVFSDQIQRIILQKQEEAKYVQSEKQLLENRIFELEDIIAELKEQLAHRVTIFEQLKKEHEKLQIHLQNANERCEGLQLEIKQLEQKSRSEINSLNNKIFAMQSDFKNKIQKIQLDKQKELQSQQRLHRSQLQKIQNRRAQELSIKNQQLKDLSATFEAETKRLNDAIAKQDQYIKSLNQAIKQEKENLLGITKQFTIQITTLKNENEKMRGQCFNLSKSLQKEKEQVKKMKSASSQTSANMEDQMKKLKKQLEQAQLAFVKQRDRLLFEAEDMKSQIIILRKHAQSSGRLVDQNNALCREIRGLKELLMESSLEMERCKDQFIQLATDKQTLIVKLHELDLQNQKLHRIALDRQQEAQGWRESYYKHRR